MDTINNGEHARFMWLRDYFAAQALPSAIQHELAIRAERIAPDSFRFDRVAESAYAVADAMLRARAAKSPRETMDDHVKEFGK